MSKFYLICFDVADDSRLRAVSKTLADFGTRVQHSIFECYLDEKDHQTLQQKLATIIDHEADHVRYYTICPKDKNGMLLDGKNRLSKNNSYHLM